MDRRLVIAAVLGGAGLIGYALYRRQKDAEAAALLSAGIQPARPGLFEVLVGSSTAVFSEGLKKLTAEPAAPAVKTGLEALQAKVMKRGTTHFLAWSAAFRTGKSFYVVGAKCFRTADGAEVPGVNCPVLQLEGF